MASLGAIKFPVLRSLCVSGYQLFPDHHGQEGIDREIFPGVTAIAGINGLGKTTLLNIIQRLLLGPYNPTRANLQKPGTKKHDLTKVAKFTQLAVRVQDHAVNARASGLFEFGDQNLLVERRLGDLGVTLIEVNGRPIRNPNAESFEKTVLRLAGVSST